MFARVEAVVQHITYVTNTKHAAIDACSEKMGLWCTVLTKKSRFYERNPAAIKRDNSPATFMRILLHTRHIP